MTYKNIPSKESSLKSPTALVVDDEESFTEALTLGLEREGFRVLVANDSVTALELLAHNPIDIVLLDLMLPGISGIDICREIRQSSDVPVIVVTAKSSEVDAVVSLEVGADDYVSKPYRLKELIARMRAVLRRKSDEGSQKELGYQVDTGILTGEGVRLDPDRHRVWVDDIEILLPPKEFKLLRVLLENKGRVLERHVLLERVWGYDYEGDPRTLDVHVKRIRSKLEADPGRPLRITTIRGVGYRFEEPHKKSGGLVPQESN